MSDLIKREDAIKALCDAVDNKGDYEGEWLYTDEFCKAIDSVPSADRPQGDVDAVAIFMREMHNLEQGYITISEFDERIEPLRHLCYDRPQGEWELVGERIQYKRCPYCKRPRAFQDTRFCDWCGARMKGAEDDR